MPAKAGIQYAAQLALNADWRGILDHPPSRMMTDARCAVPRNEGRVVTK